MNDAGVPRAAMGLGLAGLMPAFATVAALLVWPEMQDGVAPGWWLALRRPLSLGMAALHAAAMVILLVSQGR